MKIKPKKKIQPLYRVLIEFIFSFYRDIKRKKSALGYLDIIFFIPTAKKGVKFVKKITSPKIHKCET